MNADKKYKNKEKIVDGIKFDSKLEARRYIQLKLLQRAGEITDLRMQVEFVLQPSYKKNGKTIRAIKYIADFVYYDVKRKETIVEDTKGFRNEVYKLKKKIFEYIYPYLQIKEINKNDI